VIPDNSLSLSTIASIPIIFWTNIVGFFTRTSYIQVEFSVKDYHRKQRRREREAKRRQMALQLSRFDASDENLVESKYPLVYAPMKNRAHGQLLPLPHHVLDNRLFVEQRNVNLGWNLFMKQALKMRPRSTGRRPD
jgi:hypothetical protein